MRSWFQLSLLLRNHIVMNITNEAMHNVLVKKKKQINFVILFFFFNFELPCFLYLIFGT